ncbi:M23 family metallopeptidase [Stenotrophomonas humi]
MRAVALLLLAFTVAPSHAEQATISMPGTIEQVLARPLFNEPYMCSEHAAGELPHPGDDLGQDCMIAAFDEGKEPLFLRLYRTDGSKNEDWYGWNHPVYSPCDCDVVKIHVNPVTNQPGQQNESRASSVILRTSDGTMFVVAHLQEFVTREGSRLKAGDQIGFVGNNGYARAPHVHIGAWRGKQALQVRWDQRAMKIH